MKKRTILWLFVGLFAGCVISSIFYISLGGGLYWLVSQEPKDISVNLIAPIEVKKDEGFEVEIAITNSANRPKELNSIDVDYSYLKGLYVHGSEPDLVEYYISEDDEYWSSFWYYLEIPANSTLTVVLRLKAREVGDYAGQISVCINYEHNCLYYSTRIVVTE